jgi:predicted RNA-binding protein with PIN domain
MPYLIDGNNFIGFLAQSELQNPKSRLTLVRKLLAFQKIKNTKIYLVFDGAPDPQINGNTLPENRFFVLYPGPGQNADTVIKKIITRQTDRRRFFVVSSDREIKDFARSKRAKSVDNKEFHKELKQALKEHKKLAAEAKNISFPSPLEVKHWMEIFKKRK